VSARSTGVHVALPICATELRWCGSSARTDQDYRGCARRRPSGAAEPAGTAGRGCRCRAKDARLRDDHLCHDPGRSGRRRPRARLRVTFARPAAAAVLLVVNRPYPARRRALRRSAPGGSRRAAPATRVSIVQAFAGPRGGRRIPGTRPRRELSRRPAYQMARQEHARTYYARYRSGRDRRGQREVKGAGRCRIAAAGAVRRADLDATTDALLIGSRRSWRCSRASPVRGHHGRRELARQDNEGRRPLSLHAGQKGHLEAGGVLKVHTLAGRPAAGTSTAQVQSRHRSGDRGLTWRVRFLFFSPRVTWFPDPDPTPFASVY